MTELIILSIAALMGMSIISVVSYLIVSTQQRTIDRLTDKLMAKDYKEFRTLGTASEQPQRTKKKPLSWYDDHTEDDEEVAN